MELGTALIIIFGISVLLYMLTTNVGRGVLGVIVALVILGAMYSQHQSSIESAAWAVEDAEAKRICGTTLDFAKHDRNAENCDYVILQAKGNKYATHQCGGEYNTPHKKGYTACVARNYLQVCKSVLAVNTYLESSDTERDRECDLLASRLAQFKD